jgi:hypothetical protein
MRTATGRTGEDEQSLECDGLVKSQATSGCVFYESFAGGNTDRQTLQDVHITFFINYILKFSLP